MSCTGLNSSDYKCQQLQNAPKEFLAVLMLNVLIVIITLIFLRYFWVRPLGIEFPIFDEYEETKITMYSLKDALLFNARHLWQFDQKYWTKVCGVEGFQYLYVQRQFFVLMLIFLCISFISLFTVPNVSFQTLFMLDQKFTYGYQCLMTTIYTIVLLWYLNNMMHAVTSVDDDIKSRWLHQHTIHLKGLPPDLSADNIQYNIQKYLGTPEPIGNVLSVITLPDYASILELEITKNEWDAYAEYLSYEEVKPPLLMLSNQIISYRRCLPRRYQDPDYYLEKCHKQEEKQCELLQDLNPGSGHAFVVVDTDESVSHLIDKEIINKFNETFCGHIEEHHHQDSVDQSSPRRQRDRKDVHTLIKKSRYDSSIQNSPRTPHVSPDIQFPNNQVQELHYLDNQVSLSLMGQDQGFPLLLIVKEAPPPDDILFINFTQSIKSDLCRSITFNIVVFLLLFFCTSPASIFQYVGLQSTVGSLSHNVFLQYTVVLLVDGINSVILLLIEYSVDFQKPSGRWIYQRSVYNRCVFYLTMNMLFIPAASIVAITNIYQLLFQHMNNIIELIQSIYFLVNGKFFASLILASASSAFGLYMTRIIDLYYAWGSAKFATFQRKKIQKQSIQMRRPGSEFRYGYFYGLQIAVLYIVMTFCTNVPIIQFCGAIYYILRLYQDSFILLWYFREDMNSQSQLAQKVILSAGISVIPLQLVDLTIFLAARKSLYFLVTLILLAVTIMANIHMSSNRDNLQKAKRVNINQSSGQPSTFEIQAWEKKYKHPLTIINDSQIILRKQ